MSFALLKPNHKENPPSIKSAWLAFDNREAIQIQFRMDLNAALKFAPEWHLVSDFEITAS